MKKTKTARVCAETPGQSSMVFTPRTGHMTLTEALAAHLRTDCLYPRQRTLSAANISRLSFVMRRNEWIPEAAIAVAVLPDGRIWLINGNHTCEAVMRTGIAISVTMICHYCDSEEDAHRYYASYDNHKPRSPADHRRAMGDDSLPMARHLFQAAGFIIGGYEARMTPEVASRTMRSAIANQYADEGALLSASLSKGVSENTRVIKRVPVVAVAVETFKHQKDAAAKFWGDAAHDRGDVDHPSRAMIRQLRGFHNVTSRTWRDQAKVVVLAWNAFMAGEKRMHFKPNQATAFKLAGTPIDLNAPPPDTVVGVRVTEGGLRKTSAVVHGGV